MPKIDKRVRLTLKLSPEMYKRFKICVIENDTMIQRVLENLVCEYVAKNEN